MKKHFTQDLKSVWYIKNTKFTILFGIKARTIVCAMIQLADLSCWFVVSEYMRPSDLCIPTPKQLKRSSSWITVLTCSETCCET